jgi:hypothetical protein
MRKIFIAIVSLFAGFNALAQSTRTMAVSNLTFYVAPPTTYPDSTPTSCLSGYFGTTSLPVTVCGSDVPGCGAISAPCASPQYAVNIAYRQYDWAGQFAPTIQLASLHGGQFYYGGVQLSGALVGQPGAMPPLVVNATAPPFPIGNYNPFVIQADPTNHLAAFLTPCTHGLPCGIPAFSTSFGAGVKLSGVTLDTSLEPQDTFDAFGSIVDVGNIGFGNAGNGSPSDYNLHMGCAWGALLIVSNPLTVEGGSAASFLQAGSDCIVYPNNNGAPGLNIPVKFNGAPHYNVALFQADHATLYLQGLTLSGAPTSPLGLLAVDTAAVQTASGGAGPHTCTSAQFLGLPVNVQDNSSCR